MILRKRSAFTLMEVIVAMSMGMILLAALYFVLELNLRSVRSAREVLMESKIVRGITNRISADIRESLALLISTPSVETMLGTNAATATTDSSASGNTTTPPEPGQINVGFQSTGTELTFQINRFPRYSQLDADQAQSTFGDIRTIQYAMTSEGLIRAESTNALSSTQDAMQTQVLASEVTELRFQFFDTVSGSWSASWDGTTQGLPSAIEIVMTIAPPSITGLADKPAKQHRIVVAIPTAGLQEVPASASSTTGGTQ